MCVRVGVFAAMLLLFSNALFGQRFSYGVDAGTALTKDFSAYYYLSAGSVTLERSGGKGVIVGPTLEWNFSPDISLEVDGLFRELRFEDLHGGAHNPTVTWEFPMLVKYSLSNKWPSLRPFAEAGPSLRTTGNLNANPSHVGMSAGAGFYFKLHQINIAPTLRYTRWAQDSHPFGIQSRPDQLEFLIGFSHTAMPDSRPFGGRFSIGVVLGTNFLGDYNTTSSTANDVSSGSKTIFSSRSGPQSFLIGPAVELQMSGHFSLEADAIYRPIREQFTITQLVPGQTALQSGNGSSATWQLPAMVKYSPGLSFWRDQVKPFVEMGPSFRISGSVTHFGFTAGSGVSTHLGPVRMAPAIRYIRWQADPLNEFKSDEANLLVSFIF